MYPIEIVSDVPVYLCTWNDGELVEIHTMDSLYEKYKDTNLFDYHDIDEEVVDFRTYVSQMELSEGFWDDNLTVSRIK